MPFDAVLAAVVAILAAIVVSVPVFALAHWLAPWFAKGVELERSSRPRRSRRARATLFSPMIDLLTPRVRATVGIALAITLAIGLVLALFIRQTGFALR